jgi:hypothetical protein
LPLRVSNQTCPLKPMAKLIATVIHTLDTLRYPYQHYKDTHRFPGI